MCTCTGLKSSLNPCFFSGMRFHYPLVCGTSNLGTSSVVFIVVVSREPEELTTENGPLNTLSKKVGKGMIGLTARYSCSSVTSSYSTISV